MLVVYYCAVDISDYIVLFRCKVCSIVIFLGVELYWPNFQANSGPPPSLYLSVPYAIRRSAKLNFFNCALVFNVFCDSCQFYVLINAKNFSV